MKPPTQALSILDWIGIVLTVPATLTLFVFPIAIAPSYLSMFADFGGELPAITRLVLSPWFTPMLGLIPVGLLIGAWRAGLDRIGVLRALVVAAFVSGMVGVAFTWIALYQPMSAMADAIQP